MVSLDSKNVIIDSKKITNDQHKYILKSYIKNNLKKYT